MSESSGQPGVSAPAGGPQGFRLAATVITYFRLYVIIVGAVLLYGVISFVALPRSEDPEFDTVDMRVTVVYPGASAAKVRDLVTKPLEEAIEQADGVRKITAESSNGLAFLKVKLFNETDPQEGAANVEEQIDGIRDQLPEGAFEPFVLLLNTGNIPINIIALTGPDDYRLLDEWSQVLSDELSLIDEIASADIDGLPERQITVRIDNDRLAQYRIPLLQVANVLGVENAGVPGGKLDIGSRRLVLKTPNDYRSLEDIAATVIGGSQESLVRLGDVATVEDGHAEPRYRFRTNGHNAVLVLPTKREGTNNVEIAEQVRAAVDRLRARLPEGLDVHVVSDRGASVEALLTDLGWNAVGGGVAVILVVTLFLGFRQAMVVSISIPLSILIAFVLMSWTGLQLTQFSIFGLVLALGMLVDSALVVVENIGRRLEMGNPLFEAVAQGVEDVKLPVISSTLTTVAAFVPMLVIEGNIGSFIRELPLTVIYSLTASLVVALTVIPLVLYVLWRSWPPVHVEEKEWPLVGHYLEVAKFALRHRLLTVVVAVTAFVMAIAAIPMLGIQFFPKAEKRYFYVNIRLPSDANLATTSSITAQVEDLLAQESDIRAFTSCIGVGCPYVYYNVEPERETPSYAQILVNVRDDYPKTEVEAYALSVNEKLQQIAGVDIQPRILEQGPGGDADIEIRIRGDDTDTLASLAREVVDRMQGVEGLVDLRDSLGFKSPQLAMEMDRDRAALLGVDSRSFSQTLYAALDGLEATQYRGSEDEIPLVVRMSSSSIRSVADLSRLYLPSTRGGVALGEVATPRETSEFASTNRIDGESAVLVRANVVGRLTDQAMIDVRRELADLELPTAYRMELGGENEERNEAFTQMGAAMVLSILLIYAILAIQFNSFVQPFVILFTVPFGIVGAIVGLLVTGNPFGFNAFIGVVSLTGIIINDSIVLTDFANYLQRVEGKGLYESLLEAGRVRFRPVLTTSLTTIAGMAPLAVWGGSLWSPVAVVVIFGLAFATLLILILLPVIYALLVRPKEGRRAFRFWSRVSARLLGRA
ncbi:MAG TPA: efflux RND transporter permease subunit [Thermoanaerobaculia bacterium]|nr:efflux RND transporter permease subunit [Thermoanaerobaculia bacterium]